MFEDTSIVLKQYFKKLIGTDDIGYQNFKIGGLLKELREKSGLTQEELAKN